MKVFLVTEEVVGMWAGRAIAESGEVLDGQQAATKAAAIATLKERLGSSHTYSTVNPDSPSLRAAMESRPMPREADNQRIAEELRKQRAGVLG